MTAEYFDRYQRFPNTFGRNGRYEYAMATKDDEVSFIKRALNQREEENLQRELLWNDFYSAVTHDYPDLQLKPLSRIELIDPRSLVTEWIDAPFVAEPSDGEGWARVLGRYTGMLCAFDEAAEDYVVPEHLSLPPDRDFEQVLTYWLRNVGDEAIVTKAREYVTAKAHTMTKRMQHGDLTPWQIFDRSGTWTVIDGERSGVDLPRFNDLAYGYGRLAIRCNEPESAEELLHGFIEQRQLPPTVVEDQIKPVLVLRLLGMLGDAANDKQPKKYSTALRVIEYCINL